MADFDRFKIDIRQNTLDWGPFVFDFEASMPTGVTVSAVTLKSYLGRVIPKDDLDDETETTSELIDSIKTVVSGNYNVNAYFNYPTTAAYLGGVKHTLVFNLTMSNGSTHSWYGYYVWAY